ncbi:MAG TPA: 2-phospho-L-lactate guanylyltransferase [Acidimicrobiia bacterium]|jgi:2-phospho-L-lactate guanylyltransferase
MAVLVVPIRSFRSGFARLATRLDGDERRTLAQRLADGVADAAGTMELVVVSSDRDVVVWAEGRGAIVVDDPGSLDTAAEAGRAFAREQGAERVVVAHADLPFVSELDRMAAPGADPVALIVPDRHHDGTPVLSLPADAEVAFQYGPGSFARHVAAARAVGLTVEVVRDELLGFDIDEPADLDAATARDTRR